MKYKLVAFDMDGTLIEDVNSWRVLHDHFGTYEESRKNLEAYINNNIDYEEFMRRDIEAWIKRHGRVSIWEIKSILDRLQINLSRRIEETINELKERGMYIAIISAGIDILAYRVGDMLGIDKEYIIANGFEVDEQGYLTGRGVVRVVR